jgi:hypothetical protein
MLEYVITNNASYFIKYTKLKFDDQYAYSDYAFKVAPADIALDYHQQLFATFSIHAPGEPHEGVHTPCFFLCHSFLYS